MKTINPFEQKCDPIEVAEYRKKHKCVDMQVIADEFGITRERVRQILKRAGLRTTALGYGDAIKYVCPECGGHKCSGSIMCRKCRISMNHVKISCTNCEELIDITISRLIRVINKNGQDLFFCNKHCQGKWLGKTYGVKKGEYRGGGGKIERKYDYDKVMEYYKTHTAEQTSLKFGMCVSYVYVMADSIGFQKRRVIESLRKYDYDEVVYLYCTKTAKEVEEELGVPAKTVMHIGRKCGFDKSKYLKARYDMH